MGYLLKNMRRKYIYIIGSFTFLIFLIGIISSFNETQDDLSSKVKVALRAIGHQLLLSQKDSTSLILPIVEIGKGKYQISFEKEFSIEPSNLVNIVQKSIEKASLPINYIVEVKQCSNQEVVYSYQMKNTKENSIIPCAGRLLEKNCYMIELGFVKKTNSIFSNQFLLFTLLLIVLFLLSFIYFKRKPVKAQDRSEVKYDTLGDFQFYPDQNKLVNGSNEISLSKKECELLAIFIANPNQIIKRDELTKRVWEDHGVIVGRSLDTYISKLRKKLKEDDSIKITNIHGVGYKLEV